MTAHSRIYVVLSAISIIILASLAANIIWVIPNLHALRTKIDNDRASMVVIQSQQSNVTQLAADLESIQTKEAELEVNIWTFLEEDEFFTALDNLADITNVVIDPPAIADATPTGEIISRAVTLNIHGELEEVLAVVNAIQSVKPFIAIQKIHLTPGDQTGQVELSLEANTLWK